MKTTVLTNAELGTYAYNETYDTMEYNWAATCSNGNHGLEMDYNNCNNLNSYSTSKVKELEDNLGYKDLHVASGYSIVPTESTPNFVYSDFGVTTGVYGYWTMTIGYEVSNFVWSVYNDGSLHENDVNGYFAIRPVINLLKSAIPSQS